MRPVVSAMRKASVDRSGAADWIVSREGAKGRSRVGIDVGQRACARFESPRITQIGSRHLKLRRRAAALHIDLSDDA